MRPDLADIRLAGRVFAPHYAAALPRLASSDAAVTVARGGGEVIARLRRGDRFELLDQAGGRAWGIVTSAGVVGYVDEHALEPAA